MLGQTREWEQMPLSQNQTFCHETQKLLFKIVAVYKEEKFTLEQKHAEDEAIAGVQKLKVKTLKALLAKSNK